MSRTLFLDLDRTLFDTNKYLDKLWRFIGITYQLDDQQERQNYQQFCSYNGDLYDYDFFGHLRSAGIKDEAAFVKIAQKALAHEQFLYDDVVSVLPALKSNYDCCIVTYGGEAYQTFKLSFLPELADMQLRITQENKGDFLSRAYPNDSGWLIDDKDYSKSMPKSITLVRLDRMYKDEPADTIVIHNFNELTEVLK